MVAFILPAAGLTVRGDYQGLILSIAHCERPRDEHYLQIGHDIGIESSFTEISITRIPDLFVSSFAVRIKSV